MERTAIVLIFTLALLVGVIFLQIYLSKRESKWPGLVLPIIAFLWGLLYPLSTAVPSEGVTVGFIFQMLFGFFSKKSGTLLQLPSFSAHKA